jgi:hypothetical protein
LRTHSSHPQSPKIIQIFTARQFLTEIDREATLSKPLRTLDHVTEDIRGLSLSINNRRRPMKIYNTYGLCGWNEHATLARKTLKADDHREKHSKLQKNLKADAY